MDASLPIVKFECGCYGLVLADGQRIMIQNPNRMDDNDLTLAVRDKAHQDKTYVAAEDHVASRLTQELTTLIADGYRFRELQALLLSVRGTSPSALLVVERDAARAERDAARAALAIIVGRMSSSTDRLESESTQ